MAGVHRRTLARDVRVVAVVGSFGKTTTTRALMATLGKDRLPQIGLNSLSHVAAAVLRIRPRDKHAVVEVGSAGKGQAVELVKGDLLPGDVVLIKGRTSQRLGWLALALQGRAVRCNIDDCTAGAWMPCERCPMLERGWDGLRVVM